MHKTPVARFTKRHSAKDTTDNVKAQALSKFFALLTHRSTSWHMANKLLDQRGFG